MKAKLEWDVDHLMLGGKLGWTIGAVVRHNSNGMWRYVLNRVADYGDWCERRDDAAQDCEREVRRLLREAGVEL